MKTHPDCLPPTVKQRSAAAKIKKYLGVDAPKIQTKAAYAQFIKTYLQPALFAMRQLEQKPLLDKQAKEADERARREQALLSGVLGQYARQKNDSSPAYTSESFPGLEGFPEEF